MWLAALQTVSLYVLMPNTQKAPLLATLAPVPLLLSIAGRSPPPAGYALLNDTPILV